MFCLLATAWLSLSAAPLFSQMSAVEIEGVVKNGTTGKPVANQRMILLSPSQGMEEVSSVVSDASGHFKFEKATGPFFVVQTHYQGANYDQPVRPEERGLTQTNVTVYEATTSNADVTISRAQWRLVPNAGKLRIEEVFEVKNTSKPPSTFVRSGGEFLFSLPAGASVQAASVEEAAGMPLPQTPQEVEPGKTYAISRPIQPGTTRVGIQFEADYGSQSYHFSQKLADVIGELDIFFPQDMQVNAAPALQKSSEVVQGYQVYVARNSRPNDTIALDISGGTPPPEAASGDEGGGDQPNVTALPNAIGAIQLPLVSLLSLIVLWSLGFAVFHRTDKKKDGLTEERRKQLTAQKDFLIRRILELDDQHASQTITDRDYHLQRSRLKSKCAQLVRLLQPAGRKREKPVA